MSLSLRLHLVTQRARSGHTGRFWHSAANQAAEVENKFRPLHVLKLSPLFYPPSSIPPHQNAALHHPRR